VKNENEKVRTFFSLYTIDYPDVQFDWSHIQDVFTVHEESRKKSGEETVIEFSLDINMENKDALNELLEIRSNDNSMATLSIPVLCYKDMNNITQPALTTSQISLGAIRPNEFQILNIYGDPDVIQAIKEVWLDGFSESFTAQMVFEKTQNDTLTIHFQIEKSVNIGNYEGKILFKTFGNRIYSVALFCEVENELEARSNLPFD
jgi:hypothetical protein